MDGQAWYSNIGGFLMQSILFRVIVFGVLGVAGYSQVSESNKDDSTRSETGEVVESGAVGVQVLKIGDCVQLPPGFDELAPTDSTSFASMVAVPCTELHDSELFSTKTLNLTEYPGEDALYGELSDFCVDDYVAYTGSEFDTSSPHSILPVIPVEEGWKNGDKVIQCFARMNNGEQLGATIKN
jgi:hypothetical protein